MAQQNDGKNENEVIFKVTVDPKRHSWRVHRTRSRDTREVAEEYARKLYAIPLSNTQPGILR